jgi:hypothetical protein
LDSLNIQGVRHAIYVNHFGSGIGQPAIGVSPIGDGEVEGIVRAFGRGGDLIQRANGTVYLVALVLEQWPDWTKFAATIQNVQAGIGVGGIGVTPVGGSGLGA